MVLEDLLLAVLLVLPVVVCVGLADDKESWTTKENKTEEKIMIRRMIYMGRDFYMRTKTMGGILYEIKGRGKFERFDYGFMEIALNRGERFLIRKATTKERHFIEVNFL